MTTRPDLTHEQQAALLSGHDFWSTEAIEEAGIPSVVLTDGPHGVRCQSGDSDHLGLHASLPATCFPLAVAVGSSWDRSVAEEVGRAVGREARALGVHVVLGPGVNIKRSPLCGRNFEYYSEDPLLSGVLGAAHVRGLQSVGVGACVKHFAANNQETDRMRVSADVDDRTLREIYLPAFERVVAEARPAAVMCSYNKVNGVSAAENRWLLTEVLREQWGFTGVVVSDWGAVADRVAGVTAGLDLEMPGSGGGTDRQVVDAVRDGRLDPRLVEASAHRVLALSDLVRPAAGDLDLDGQHALARRLAADCAVLLKNDDGVLPLRRGQHVAVLGSFAATPRFQGGGSSHIAPTRVDPALDAVRALAAAHGLTVSAADGFPLGADGDARALLDEAVRVAAAADVAVVFAGLTEREESEGFDRDTLDLPPVQVALVRAVAQAAPRTVVVLAHGGVVSLEGWHDEVDAILDGWLLGQAGGSAIADLLLGVANPSGHLAETVPLRLEDTPSYLNFPGEQGHVRYGEGVMVGYRGYETLRRAVRYPFGHGLSYTTFVTESLDVALGGDGTVAVRVRVRNAGDRAGKHVVQVYVATDAGPVRRPVRELRAFEKIELAPGEARDVELTLERRAFAYWDVELDDWVVALGEYAIQVCADAATVLEARTVTLAGDVVSRPLSMESTVGEWFSHPTVGPAFLEVLAGATGSAPTPDPQEHAGLLRMVESMRMAQFLTFLPIPVPQEKLDELLALGGTVANSATDAAAGNRDHPAPTPPGQPGGP
ncbi:beta-glucosidase [Rhodococcus aetherivorans]|uniref:Beta-glucosidase n=1 Tax=Rhodococcus aetherivorans TaxID=191292 RepID=A0ABQ0YSV9_9NOCA|nr:glycoside hydrolase family 3 C-terminal domain-containing protein [Rhodococcus aetherivorans]ETT26683.1 Beta-glucosidase [Rhodococcus rhodochrous ATCC 21198]NGP25813.1 glycosyl hydrolase [Rhodococcus aetherivorans]GES39726.1 beta-glucosidase [Rhodococcus aetherivorans]